MSEISNEAAPESLAPETPAPETPAPAQPSQAAINAAAAKNRRAMQKELAEAKQKAAAFEEFNSVFKEMAENPDADPISYMEQLQSAADAAKTQEQKAADSIAAMEKRLNQAQEVANQTLAKYNTATVQRSISDEAADMVVEGPGREGAIELFQLKLGPLAEVQEDGSVLVNWEVTNEAGRVEKKLVPVKDALKAMEANPTKYGRAFKSTVNGGAGGETIDGIGRTPDGGIDFANMDFQKFQELATKNPALLNDMANKLEF